MLLSFSILTNLALGTLWYESHVSLCQWVERFTGTAEDGTQQLYECRVEAPMWMNNMLTNSLSCGSYTSCNMDATSGKCLGGDCQWHNGFCYCLPYGVMDTSGVCHCDVTYLNGNDCYGGLGSGTFDSGVVPAVVGVCHFDSKLGYTTKLSCNSLETITLGLYSDTSCSNLVMFFVIDKNTCYNSWGAEVTPAPSNPPSPVPVAFPTPIPVSNPTATPQTSAPFVLNMELCNRTEKRIALNDTFYAVGDQQWGDDCLQLLATGTEELNVVCGCLGKFWKALTYEHLNCVLVEPYHGITIWNMCIVSIYAQPCGSTCTNRRRVDERRRSIADNSFSLTWSDDVCEGKISTPETPTQAPTRPTQSPTGGEAHTVPTMRPTARPAVHPTEDCTATKEWSQARSEELCAASHHAYGVGLCPIYDNPNYQSRLEFALANELYSSCSSACVYDYDTYNSISPNAFKFVNTCYNVQSGKWSCIDDEVSSMEEAHERAATLCEPTEPCKDRVGWTPEVAESNCPAVEGYGGKDKGYGSAKVCNKLERQWDGFYERTDVLYQASFNASLANHMFRSCNAKCIYDVEVVGVVYQWKGQDCWEMQREWACITIHATEYAWAMDYLGEEFCPIATPAPVTYPCVERELDWDEATASNICSSEYMGDTDKSENAIACAGYEDYQYRLGHSLANRAFLTCDAWCVYDIYKRGHEGFIWRNSSQCWKPVTSGLCIGGNPSHREAITDYIDNTLCESTTPEPTEAPTCRTQYEWSEALMDDHCSVADTALTYKHYTSLGRAAMPCTGFEAREADLLKSLAMKLYGDCSSWCVYDFYSLAVMAWKWKDGANCWELTTWGSCHWNYAEGRNNTEWLDARDAVMVTCTYEPTLAPTGCMPAYTWDADRAVEVCPSIQTADKSFGVQVCTDTNSASKQAELEKSLANRFFSKCDSWCVYDYDTIIDNVIQEGNTYGGFIWRNTDQCWKWVTGYQCFTSSIDEYDEVVVKAGETCAGQR